MLCLGWLLDGRDLLAGGCVLRGAEDQFLSVGDATYRVVSCLCVMMGNIRRASRSVYLRVVGVIFGWRGVGFPYLTLCRICWDFACCTL